MAIYHRKLWQNKPRQWGPVSRVQSGLFRAVERLGIDSGDISLAMPCWGPGDQQDYSTVRNNAANTAADFVKNRLSFNGSSSILALQESFSTNSVTLVFRAKQHTSGSAGMVLTDGGTVCYVSLMGGNYLRWKFGVTLNFTAITDFTNMETYCLSGNNTDDLFSLYQNGIKKQSITQSSAYLPCVITNIGAGYNGGFSYALNGEIEFVLAFNNEQKESICSALSENPYQLWQPYAPPVYFVIIDSGTTITATTGAVEITGINAGISASTTITATTDAISIAGIQADVENTRTITATTDAVSVTGIQADISAGTTVTATTDAVSVTGIQADISTGETVTATTGAVAVSGIQAGISAGKTITATTDTVSVTSYAATVNTGQTVTATTGTLAVSGIQAGVSAGATITATTDAVTIAGIQATISNELEIVSTTGAVEVAGVQADISAGTTLTATTGTIAATSYAATVSNVRTITATTAALGITGINAELSIGKTFAATTEALLIAGIQASISTGSALLTPDSRVYSIDAEDRVYSIAAENRTYIIT